jgi:hypothetical protein
MPKPPPLTRQQRVAMQNLGAQLMAAESMVSRLDGIRLLSGRPAFDPATREELKKDLVAVFRQQLAK